MKHEAYKVGDFYKIKCSNKYEDGIHTHITYWDIEHNESLRDIMNDTSIDMGGLSNISDFMFGKIDFSLKIGQVWRYKENEEEGIVKKYSYYGELVKEEKTPKNGSMKTYHDNGKMEYELSFKNGLKHGLEVSYKEDGYTKNWERSWYKGYKDGNFISYYGDEKGILGFQKKSLEDKWKMGELISSWNSREGYINIKKEMLDID